MLTTAWAQVPQPAAPQTEPIIIMNATAHLGNGEVIENSAIAFKDGVITMVVDATTARIDMSGYQVVNAQGKHVYPGLILPVTNLGLTEVNAVRATRDFNEVGAYTPHVNAQVAYNTDSEIIATLRYN
ncbi:MAG TPA: amidohydrolase, partial [Cytophagales bacterium]|nr:amidohydrolase [Cytophagales bacterium]